MTENTPKWIADDLHQFMRSRHSVRQFLPEPVPADVIRRVLETAVQAPSAHNRQPWRFAVLISDEEKQQFAAAMGEDFRKDLEADGLPKEDVQRMVDRSFRRIMQSPVVVLLCLTMIEMDEYPDRKRSRAEFRMAMQSVALAGGQMLLAAHAEGLGAVWICAPLFAQSVIRTVLDLPGDWEPQGMILMGYPAVTPEPRPRKSIEAVSVFR